MLELMARSKRGTMRISRTFLATRHHTISEHINLIATASVEMGDNINSARNHISFALAVAGLGGNIFAYAAILIQLQCCEINLCVAHTRTQFLGNVYDAAAAKCQAVTIIPVAHYVYARKYAGHTFSGVPAHCTCERKNN